MSDVLTCDFNALTVRIIVDDDGQKNISYSEFDVSSPVLFTGHDRETPMMLLAAFSLWIEWKCSAHVYGFIVRRLFHDVKCAACKECQTSQLMLSTSVYM
jgi:hypothetical protein